MSRVLVAYGTKHGATREIAEAIAEELRRAGHGVDCMEAEAVKGVDDYDAVDRRQRRLHEALAFRGPPLPEAKCQGTRGAAAVDLQLGPLR